MKTNSSSLVPFPEARVQCYQLSEDKANPFIHCSFQMQSETIHPHLLTSLNKTSFSMYSEHRTRFGRELQVFIPCPVNHYRSGDESLTDKAVFPLRRHPKRTQSHGHLHSGPRQACCHKQGVDLLYIPYKPLRCQSTFPRDCSYHLLPNSAI